MSLEQRLSDAFRQTERIQPTPDLWSRVVHSIEEDRAHRRRVLGAAAASVAMLAAVVLTGLLNVRDVARGRAIDRELMMVLELVSVTALALVLGPAIRRFGRNYAEDLWPSRPAVAIGLLRLLDIAYGLVFSGYIFLTTRIGGENLLQEQLADAALRVGGLLLVMGVLHAVTLMVLPIVALVDNSTWRGRALPKWLVIAGVVFLVTQIVPLFPIGVSGLFVLLD